MAINKKLIHFNSKENFDNKVANNEILDTSIVFVKDSKEIWTHGNLYKSVNWDVLKKGVEEVLTEAKNIDLGETMSYLEEYVRDTDSIATLKATPVDPNVIVDENIGIIMLVNVNNYPYTISGTISSLLEAGAVSIENNTLNLTSAGLEQMISQTPVLGICLGLVENGDIVPIDTIQYFTLK